MGVGGGLGQKRRLRSGIPSALLMEATAVDIFSFFFLPSCYRIFRDLGPRDRGDGDEEDEDDDDEEEEEEEVEVIVEEEE